MKKEISRIREKGTKNFVTEKNSDKINACRIILHDKAYAKIDGIMIDHFSASAIVKVYENLSAENQEKFISKPIEHMGITAFRLLERLKF